MAKAYTTQIKFYFSDIDFKQQLTNATSTSDSYKNVANFILNGFYQFFISNLLSEKV